MVGPFGRQLPLCFDRVMVALDMTSNTLLSIQPSLVNMPFLVASEVNLASRPSQRPYLTSNLNFFPTSP